MKVSTPWLHGFGVFAQAALALLGSTLEGGRMGHGRIGFRFLGLDMAQMKCWVPLIEYNFRDFLKTLDMLKVDKTHDLNSCWIKSFDSPRVSEGIR